MKSSKFFTSLLHTRGVHWLVTRFGSSRLRSLSFDEKFKSGSWNFSKESPELVELVEKYSAKGHVLVLGCGAAPIAKVLNPDAYDTLLGVDISQEAVNQANEHASPKVSFAVGDMIGFQCPKRYAVILFSDSLYYVSALHRKSLLKKLQQDLTPGGRIIVAIAQPHRYASILNMIRNNFTVDTDRLLKTETRHVLIFR